ncbi:MAG: ketoacyl-ACP synthase III [Lachnospiraceae bacterium]|nr:ketoacyl-ACP synthase III [Lachnospiraceae bacterium]
MTGSKILATGSGLPEMVVTNDDLGKMLEGVDDAWVYKRSGIHERRIVKDENTSDLAIKAAKDALDKAGMKGEDIELIVAASITPDYQTPNLASMVQAAIGADKAICFGVSAACSGFVFGLSTADKFVKSGAVKNALVIGAEVLSKASDWSDKNTCILFGDGAASVIIEASEEDNILAEELGSRGDKASVLTSGYFPAANAFNDERTANDSDAYIEMDGLEVFSFATKKLTSSIKNVLEKSGTSIDEIKYIVPHQANSRIIEFVAKKLGCSKDIFYLNLDRFGNTSSASIAIALDEMNGKGMLKRGDKIIISGFGGGLTWGTMLLKW